MSHLKSEDAVWTAEMFVMNDWPMCHCCRKRQMVLDSCFCVVEYTCFASTLICWGHGKLPGSQLWNHRTFKTVMVRSGLKLLTQWPQRTLAERVWRVCLRVICLSFGLKMFCCWFIHNWFWTQILQGQHRRARPWRWKHLSFECFKFAIFTLFLPLPMLQVFVVCLLRNWRNFMRRRRPDGKAGKNEFSFLVAESERVLTVLMDLLKSVSCCL